MTQLEMAIGAVVVASLYILRATWRTWSGRKVGCGNGCGKCTSAASATPVTPEGPRRVALPQV